MTNDQKVTLIVDADDTLWESEVYYQQCIAEYEALMEAQGFEREEATRMLVTVEEERIPEVGYAPEEFARSLIIAYERLSASYGCSVEEAVSARLQEVGEIVLNFPIELLDGVEETLPWLSGRYRLILLTKGDQTVQENKLTRSGLTHLFDGVHVVHEKDAMVIRELLEAYALHPARTWMIGNSPRSDINPALEAGIGAIYVPHVKTWEWERETIMESERVIKVDSFGNLIDFFSELST